MGRRLTARDLPRLAECEALFAMAKVSLKICAEDNQLDCGVLTALSGLMF
jgi:hypothetical protein